MARPTAKQVLLSVVLFVAAAGLLSLLYAASAHAFPGDSDGATVVLEGQSMSQGHLLLGGWAISLDSFWTIDALFYLVGVGIFGLHAGLLHAVPAVIALGAIALGAVMASEERRGGARLAAAGSVVAILGFPGHALALFMLRGPLHVGTVLWCLVAFLGVRRGRFGVGFVVAVVFLAAGLLGDLQMLALGVAPVFASGLVAMARRRDWRAGMPATVAAVAAVALAEIVRRIAVGIGTFTIAKANPIATKHQMLLNAKHGIHEGALLFGVGSTYYGLGGEPTWLAYAHVISLLVVFTAIAGSVVTLLGGVLRGRPTVIGTPTEAAWRLDDLLLLAALASPVAFCVLAASPDPEYARYLTAGVIFGTVLGARVIGRVVADLDPGWLTRISAGLALAIAGCFVAGTALTLTQQAPSERPVALSSFLESHHLVRGIGAYWSGAVTTTDSGGAVVVDPVVAAGLQDHAVHNLKLVRYERNSSGDWYRGSFQFLVFDLSVPWGGVTYQSAVDTFGAPSKAYTVGAYRVMVWKHPLVVPPSGGPSSGGAHPAGG